MLYYCLRMCKSIISPHSFESLYWGMLIYFLSWNLLDVVHYYLTCCVGCICCLRFSWFGHSCLHHWLARCVSECYALERIAHCKRRRVQFLHYHSTADTVSSGSWSILFNVLTLNVATSIVCLDFSNFCYLSSVGDFSNSEIRAPTSAGRASFLAAQRALRFMYVVWVRVMVIFRWLFFILIYRSHFCNGRESNGRNEFSCWTRLFAFHIALILLRMACV